MFAGASGEATTHAAHRPNATPRQATCTSLKPDGVRGDESGMPRSLRTIVLALCLATASGCMVMDEVDAAAAKMPVKQKEAQATATPSSASSAATRSQEVLENTKRWWQEATSLAPGDMDAGIARCRIDGGVQFMSRDDCLSRGGRPERGAG